MARFGGIWVAIGAMLGLGGCLDFGGQTAEVNPQWFEASAPRAAALKDGAFRVTGPAGYCVDPSSISDETPATAVLASCVALANSVYAGQPVDPAVIVVSLSDAARPLAGLDDSARQGLVQSLAGSNASIVSAEVSGGVLMAQLTDAGLPARAGLAPSHARAVFDQSGRVVSVAAYGIAGNRWSAGQSQRLVAATVQALQAANGGATPVSEMSPNG